MAAFAVSIGGAIAWLPSGCQFGAGPRPSKTVESPQPSKTGSSVGSQSGTPAPLVDTPNSSPSGSPTQVTSPTLFPGLETVTRHGITFDDRYFLHYSGEFPGYGDDNFVGYRVLCGFDSDWIDLATGATSSNPGPRSIGVRFMAEPLSYSATKCMLPGSPAPRRTLPEHTGKNAPDVWIFYRASEASDLSYFTLPNKSQLLPRMLQPDGDPVWASPASSDLAVHLGNSLPLVYLRFGKGERANVAKARVQVNFDCDLAPGKVCLGETRCYPLCSPKLMIADFAYQTATGSRVMD